MDSKEIYEKLKEISNKQFGRKNTIRKSNIEASKDENI